MPTSPLFTVEDVVTAVKDCNFNKGLGPDGFDGNLLATNKESDEGAQTLATTL